MRTRRILLSIPHTARAAYCFTRQLMLLAWEVWVVFFFMKVLDGRSLPDDHAWETGKTQDGDDIWPRNIVYRSPSKFEETTEESDAEIVRSIGRFLSSMVSRSTEKPEIPHGPKRRMPHAVNLIHGAVHHNGAFVVLDDFEDLVSHLTDRRFRRDLVRFGRAQKREVTIVFRQRKYEPLDFAHAVGAVRAHLPWFSNGNGPTKKPVLWGNMSPYPAVALINGAWMSDLWSLYRGRHDQIARPPVDSREHFAARYFGRRNHFAFLDRFLAWYMYTDVRARGFRSQLFFVNRKRIEPNRVGEYRDAGGYWKWTACHEVPPPRLRRRETPRADVEDMTLAVIIPTFDEEDEIAGCVRAARFGLDPDELVVVDGGSRDRTIEVAAQAGARVIRASGGRGGQCRAAAEATDADIIVFIHADARVTPGARRAIEAKLARGHRIAMFRQRTPRSSLVYRLLDMMTAVDSVFTRFGDQGIIVTRDFYDELGGMPEYRLFEDYAFLRKARRRTRIPRISSDLRVSPRRFEKEGLFKQLLFGLTLQLRYLTGADPDELHRRYYGQEEAA